MRLDDFDVNMSVLAASFAGESVVGFGYFIFPGIYLLLVEVASGVTSPADAGREDAGGGTPRYRRV